MTTMKSSNNSYILKKHSYLLPWESFACRSSESVVHFITGWRPYGRRCQQFCKNSIAFYVLWLASTLFTFALLARYEYPKLIYYCSLFLQSSSRWAPWSPDPKLISCFNNKLLNALVSNPDKRRSLFDHQRVVLQIMKTYLRYFKLFTIQIFPYYANKN